MEKEEVIKLTAEMIKKRQENESSGHDWWHSYRVWQLGKRIAKSENADLFVVELACLLHDISDFKLNGGDEEAGPKLAEEWLQNLSVDSQVINNVKEIIATSSFKGANAQNKIKTPEGECVQDADRLDAIGAIGIARCFAFGGNRGNKMHDPSISVNIKMSEEEYKKADHTQINHFYEKLLLLKDRMNTKTAKLIAEERHKFMERYLEQFHNEWDALS